MTLSAPPSLSQENILIRLNRQSSNFPSSAQARTSAGVNLLVVVVVKVALAALDLGNARRAAKVRRSQRTSRTAGGGRYWATGREGPKEKPTTRTSSLRPLS